MKSVFESTISEIPDNCLECYSQIKECIKNKQYDQIFTQERTEYIVLLLFVVYVLVSTVRNLVG